MRLSRRVRILADSLWSLPPLRYPYPVPGFHESPILTGPLDISRHPPETEREEKLQPFAQRSHAGFAAAGAFPLSSAKISRPAADCNALETTTVIVFPRCARAWFTTIIVPSGK